MTMQSLESKLAEMRLSEAATHSGVSISQLRTILVTERMKRAAMVFELA
jgi:hypothetical protein